MGKVLIVEDERIISMTIERSLIKRGHEITGVLAYAEKVLDSIMANRPDVVLMDIWLKGEMDGIEATRRINASSDIPVIYVTSHTDEHTIAKANTTRHHAYINKPVNIAELASVIEGVLKKTS